MPQPARPRERCVAPVRDGELESGDPGSLRASNVIAWIPAFRARATPCVRGSLAGMSGEDIAAS